MIPIGSKIDPKRFIEGLMGRGLGSEEIENLAKRSGQGKLTENDLLIIEQVRTQLSGKEEKDG